MQDIHSIEIDGSVRRRLFTIEGDQRLMPRNQQHDLKCPRCESVNTKFCYYNNYNLSQPRHFCRSCRRYWTKGGVLRNVPVGGGIRKPKRSGKHNSKTSAPTSDAVVTEHKSSISENLSCNSSSVTANTTSVNVTATTKGMTTMDVSRSSSSANSTPSMLLNFDEPSTQFFNFPQSSTHVTTIDPLMMNQFSSARNTSPDIGMFKSQQQNHLQWTETERMAEIDYRGLESRKSNVGLAGNCDWQDGANQGLFDQSYWSQNNLNDNDRGYQFSYLS